MKTDARIRYTKMIIKEHFFNLLQEKPITKITVKELCELCEINRATFYNHYKDPYDLLEQIEQEVLQEIHKVLSTTNFRNLTAFFTKILIMLKENDQWIYTICSNNGDPNFPVKVFIECYHIVFPPFVAKLPHLDETTQKLNYYFLTNGCSGIMSYWLKSGMQEDPETIAAFLTQMTRTVMQRTHAPNC